MVILKQGSHSRAKLCGRNVGLWSLQYCYSGVPLSQVCCRGPSLLRHPNFSLLPPSPGSCCFFFITVPSLSNISLVFETTCFAAWSIQSRGSGYQFFRSKQGVTMPKVACKQQQLMCPAMQATYIKGAREHRNLGSPRIKSSILEMT